MSDPQIDVTDESTATSVVNVDDDSPLPSRPEQEAAGESLFLGATVTEDGTLTNEVERTGPQPAGEDGQVVKNYETRGGRRRVEVTGPDHDRVREIFSLTLDAAGRVQ